jgi:hypothetical protein
VNTSSNPNGWLDTIVAIPVSRRGAVQTPMAVATDPYPGIEPHALVWTGHEFALLWKKALSWPCSSVFCTPISEERVTVLDEHGRVIRDVAIAVNEAILTAAAANGKILIVTAQAGVLTVRRLSLDGLASDPVVIPSDASETQATLLATDDGFQVWSEAAKRSNAIAPADFDVRMLPLDSNGKPVGPLRTVAAGARFGTVTRAFGASWFTFSIGWRPMPQAHAGYVLRSFVSSLQQRGRIVARQ